MPTCARCGSPCPDGTQPSGVGPCCWPSYHPSSADLAAFRASLLAASLRATGAPITDPAAGGAWSHERRNGIGYRILPGGYMPDGGLDWTGHWSDARREAAAMRSRAFASRVADGGLPGHPADDRATLDERLTGLPLRPLTR